MPSQATDVAAYLAEVPESRRPTLEALRDLCRKCLVGSDEGLAYGMPTYSRGGKPEVAFASQKNSISLYVRKTEVVEAHREPLAAASIGKSCLRFAKPEKIDLAVIESLLVATREAAEADC
jgi:uncharacterized protein YdhG (YjbR/CyaY superfamily)